MVRQQQQQRLHRQGMFLYASFALQTEAVVCLQATRWARTTSFSNILIVTDYVLLFRFLDSLRNADISIGHTLNAIRENAAEFTWYRIMKVSRDQVHQAHAIATRCRKE